MIGPKIASLLPLLTLVAGCGGPTLAEISEQELKLSVSGITSEPDTAAPHESAAGLSVERAALRVSQVRLSACRENTADLELGARAYDLLSEPAASERITTAVNDLCRLTFDVDVAPGELDGVPDDAAAFVAGVDASGEEVAWSSAAPLSLTFEAGAGESFGRVPLVLGLDLAIWLEGLSGSADDAAARFEAQLQSAAALYADADADGSLTGEELEPVALAE